MVVRDKSSRCGILIFGLLAERFQRNWRLARRLLCVWRMLLSGLARGSGNFDLVDRHVPLTSTTAALADLPIRWMTLQHDTVGRVALQHHLRVLADTVPLCSGNLVTVFELVMLLGSPGEIVAADLDIVVCEFTELVVVHTQQLGFLGGAQIQAGNGVDRVGDDGGHDKGVGSGGDDVGDLNVQLLPVVDDPAADAGAGVDTVQADDGVVSEEGVEDETDHSGDTVFGQHIHRVVDADPVFD